MPATLTPQQESNILSTTTKPVYVMALSYSGVEERLSCSGDIVYDGDNYLAGGVSIGRVVDSKEASFTIPASPERLLQLQNGAWRGGKCCIIHIPSIAEDDPVYDLADGIVVLDGEIVSSSFSGSQINVRATHSSSVNRLSPGYTWDEVGDHIPAAGTILTWEGENLILAAREAGQVEQYSTNPAISVGGRLSAAKLKALVDKNGSTSISNTAAGAPIEIVYGQKPVTGKIFAVGDISGDLVIGVGWCFGEIESFEDVYINDAAIPVGVTATHYKGLTTQTVDTTLSSAITAFNDDMVLRTPAGDIGLAYSVFRIPSGELDSAPTFKAVLNGRKVYDPRSDSTVYSDNSALCAGDFASNPIFGMGKTVVGLDEAADHDDVLIGGAERCRLCVGVGTTRKATSVMDLLCEYAECVWFFDQTSVRIKPDKMIGADNPCGCQIVAEPDISITTSHTETLTTEDQVKYAVQVVADNTVGSFTVTFGGTEVIAESSDGTYRAQIEATGTENDLVVTGEGDFTLSVSRLYWLETRYVKGTLSITGGDDTDAPTAVSAKYTEPNPSSPNWREPTISPVRRPGVESGDVPNIGTTLYIPGVYRDAEAQGKAQAKLVRQVNPVKYSWTTTDHGMRFRRADVIQLELDIEGINELIWVESVEMVSYGRYKVTGIRYSESHYPNELPSTASGSIPVGSIIMLEGDTVPSGWEAFTLANDKFIVGAGGAYDAGDTGGSATHPGFTTDTTTSNGHDGGGASPQINVADPKISGGFGYKYESAPTDEQATHNHSVTTGVIDPDLNRRENRLIKKTGSTAQTFPSEGLTFGLPGIATQNRTRVTAYAGRLLKAAAASANAGQAIRTLNFTSTESDYSHQHWTGQFVGQRPDLAIQALMYTPTRVSGLHSHDFALDLDRRIKRKSVALYGGIDDYPLAPGDMVLWEGSLDSLPTDWHLCDGENQTPDLRDYFLEIAQDGQEGQSYDGANEIALSGSGRPLGHGHGLSPVQGVNASVIQLSHGGLVYHTHSISESDAWTPPYYALAMIMYAP